MGLGITVIHNPQTPNVYQMTVMHQRFHTTKAFGQGTIPDDVTIEQLTDGSLQLSHALLKQPLILPTGAVTQEMFKPYTTPGSENFFTDYLEAGGLVGWMAWNNISDYPRGIKAFLTHCINIRFATSQSPKAP